MPRAGKVLIVLLLASPLAELRAGQHSGLLDRLPILTVDAPKPVLPGL